VKIFEAVEKYKNTEGLYCISYSYNGKLYGKLGYAGKSDKHAGYSRLAGYPSVVNFLGFFNGHYWDKDVHKILEARGDAKFLSSILFLNDSEWTEIVSEDKWRAACELAIQITYKTHDTFYGLTLPNYEFDTLQKGVIKETIKDLVKGDKHLIHAETGSGKTPMFYGVINGYCEWPTTTLIVTWKPNVLDEFKKYITGDDHGFLPWKWISENFRWIDMNSPTAKDDFNEPSDKHTIVAISAYKMMCDEKNATKDKKYNWIFKQTWDFLGLDEVHYGAWSMEHFADEDFDDEIISGKAAQSFFAKIKSDKVLALSATPFPNMAFSSYWEGHISQLTYVQQYQMKEAVISGKNTKKCDARYAYLPERHYWIQSVDPAIYDSQTAKGKTEFSIQSLFLDPEMKLYANQILRTLRIGQAGDLDPDDDKKYVAFTGCEKKDHVIFRQNRIVATETVFDLMESDTFYDQYKKTVNYDRAKLNDIFKNPKAMFITTGGNMTGWDMSSLNKLIYTCEPHSPTQLMQDIGRIVRMDKGKTQADVIFLSPELRVNYIVATIAKAWCAIKPENETDESWIEKNLKYSHICLYGNQIVELNWKAVNAMINQQYIDDMKGGKLEEPLIDLEWLDSVDNLGIKKDKHGALTFGKNPMKKGASTLKKSVTKKQKGAKAPTTKDEIDNRAAGLKISSLLIMFIAKHYKNYKTAEDIFANEDDICNVNDAIKNNWNELKEHIKYDVINRMIQTGAIEEVKISYEGSYQTVPVEIVSKYFRPKLPKKLTKGAICGGGNTLVNLYLENGLQEQDITYFFSNYEEMYVLSYMFPKVTFISINDLLKDKKKKMKPDCIIGNPPWDTKNDIHCEIAKKVIPLAEKVVFLMPGTFMKRNGNNRHERYRDSLGKSIVFYEDLENISQLFKIGYNEGAIFEFNNNKGTIDYDIDMNEANALMNEANALMNELNKNKKFMNLTSVKELLEDFNNQKYFVPIGTHGENILTFAKIVEKGKTEKGLLMSELLDSEFNNKNNNGRGISFKTKKEANDFCDFVQSQLVKDLMVATKAGTGNNFRHNLDFVRIGDLDKINLPKNTIKNLAARARNFKLRSK
jgi:hypothetical protein